MKWREFKYVLVLLGVFAVVLVVELSQPEPVDWTPSYRADATKPLGTYLLRNVLEDMVPGQPIEEDDQSPYLSLPDYKTGWNYLVVNQSFAPDWLDARTMLEFVERGNRIFIAADEISGAMADSLKLDFDVRFLRDSTQDAGRLAWNPGDSAGFRFPHQMWRYHVIQTDSVDATVLGTSPMGEVNFVRIDRGKGSIYVNLEPMAFTNFALSDTATDDYAFQALSVLPVSPTIWDEYYKVGRADTNGVEVSTSPMRYIVSQTALRWAYVVAIIGVVLFIVMYARRRQRVIPVVERPKNTTLEFVATVGALYHQHGDHRGIARKKAAFLLEFIRSRYNVSTAEPDAELYEAIARRSGVGLQRVRNLFELMTRIEAAADVSEGELLAFEQAIDAFRAEAL